MVTRTSVEQKQDDIKSYAFNILQRVEALINTLTYGTQWSIVFDNKKRMVYVKTMANRETRKIDLQKINLNCDTDNKALHVMDSKSQGIYYQFNSFSPAQNMKMF